MEENLPPPAHLTSEQVEAEVAAAVAASTKPACAIQELPPTIAYKSVIKEELQEPPPQQEEKSPTSPSGSATSQSQLESSESAASKHSMPAPEAKAHLEDESSTGKGDEQSSSPSGKNEKKELEEKLSKVLLLSNEKTVMTPLAVKLVAQSMLLSTQLEIAHLKPKFSTLEIASPAGKGAKAQNQVKVKERCKLIHSNSPLCINHRMGKCREGSQCPKKH